MKNYDSDHKVEFILIFKYKVLMKKKITVETTNPCN